MILGLAALLVANAASLLGAQAIARRTSTGKPHLDAVLVLLVRLALISAAVLVAGVSGLLNAWALGGLGLAALAGLLLARSFTRPKLPDLGRLLTILVGVVGLRLLLQVWFFAPSNYDATSYHLTKVAEWIRAGGFTREMGVDLCAPFPAGFELLEAWWVVFLRHDVLIELAGVEMLLLCAAGTYALAREVTLTERAAAWAAFLTVLAPGLHLSATSCLNDVAIAALVIVTMTFVLARAPWSWIALAVGIGLGMKPTYGYALPGVVLLHLLVRRNPKLAEPPLGISWGFAVAGAAIGAFWYLRNVLWFGSPIYPVGARGLVGQEGTLKVQFGPSPANVARNVLDVLQTRVYDDFTPYGPLLIHISGWGAVGFACGLLALPVVLRDDSAFRKLAAAFGVSFVSVLALVHPDPWFMRFVLFFPALLSIAVVKFLETRRPAVGVVAAALVFQFLATFVAEDLRWKDVKALAALPWRERSALVLEDSTLPPAESVAYFIVEPQLNRGESFLLYGPDFSRRVVYLRGKTASEIRAELEREKPRHLYRCQGTPLEAPLFQECLRQGFLKESGGRYYEVVLR
ncbi:MAG: hypothetical protein EHM91_02885 [Planctomycetota bacterium]|nr:MAG: hypothetical protein EHM91_02885 [Planctomycetota bacterium]